MRKIYKYMSIEEKKEALNTLQREIKDLEKEVNKEYPQIVKRVLVDTLDRYRFEQDFLNEEVNKKS
ncbi:hypothetical protein [Peribacillus simplex]|uniref:hypothetical protein n=1 Tax=Peribacillus simplex TaxID=1478 RepID=UPI003D2C31F8